MITLNELGDYMYKCTECSTRYEHEEDRNNCDSWITELCVHSITHKEWRRWTTRRNVEL